MSVNPFEIVKAFHAVDGSGDLLMKSLTLDELRMAFVALSAAYTANIDFMAAAMRVDADEMFAAVVEDDAAVVERLRELMEMPHETQ
jgi:hypothetical protein